MLDLIDRFGLILEPPADPEDDPYEFHGHEYRVAASGVLVDDSGSEPSTYEPGWLYIFESQDRREYAGTGPEVRQDFGLTVVYVVDNEVETEQGIRSRAITLELDDKRDGYLQKLAEKRNGDDVYGPRLWQDAHASADFDFLRAFSVRGVALQIVGYRFRAGG